MHSQLEQWKGLADDKEARLAAAAAQVSALESEARQAATRAEAAAAAARLQHSAELEALAARLAERERELEAAQERAEAAQRAAGERDREDASRASASADQASQASADVEAAHAEVARIKQQQEAERGRVKKAITEMRRKMDGLQKEKAAAEAAAAEAGAKAEEETAAARQEVSAAEQRLQAAKVGGARAAAFLLPAKAACRRHPSLPCHIRSPAPAPANHPGCTFPCPCHPPTAGRLRAAGGRAARLQGARACAAQGQGGRAQGGARHRAVRCSGCCDDTVDGTPYGGHAIWRARHMRVMLLGGCASAQGMEREGLREEAGALRAVC